ncbi:MULTISPECIES: hypothetical protein [unclassified Pantoea]|uniref:hypothetical protein n=1 Tax=unclassified Pantoea TaxID=2630326 RepID=UPI001CD1D59F|nr:MULTISPECIES: hypothetical protein [unclassified Pantoea]MCA1179946.1 hypothetical protein [Pantoea sp. alder69]MCA1253975.1 hypothetical protein [Pantoea sp. alder70]MCA1268440.1 hypothetical protein [Pantoea sp. alder81]
MPRDYEIKPAFIRAIRLDAAGRKVITTSAFRTALYQANHDWSIERCNEWIVRNQGGFMDITEGDGADRTYTLRNMGTLR